MIKINILTLFPNLYEGLKSETIVNKAIVSRKLELNIINIRDYSDSKHGKVDDYPYGGGEGMLMNVQPIDDAILKNNLQNTRLIYTSPKGKTIKQEDMCELAKDDEITILVGRYEGVDERLFDLYEFEFYSLGDFILTGGDLVAQVFIDGISRLIPGVLNNSNSVINDSFTKDLLEHPQYTRPETYKGLKVPEVLLSGHHKNIEQWKLEQEIAQTKEKRPDLYEKFLESERNDE